MRYSISYFRSSIAMLLSTIFDSSLQLHLFCCHSSRMGMELLGSVISRCFIFAFASHFIRFHSNVMKINRIDVKYEIFQNHSSSKEKWTIWQDKCLILLISEDEISIHSTHLLLFLHSQKALELSIAMEMLQQLQIHTTPTGVYRKMAINFSSVTNIRRESSGEISRK